MMRDLVRLGVSLNADDPDAPISALSQAVLANDVPMAKALIELGADVNKVDSVGATPLLHAISVDFGDVEMVRALLAAGASPAPRSKASASAEELAGARLSGLLPGAPLIIGRHRGGDGWLAGGTILFMRRYTIAAVVVQRARSIASRGRGALGPGSRNRFPSRCRPWCAEPSSGGERIAQVAMISAFFAARPGLCSSPAVILFDSLCEVRQATLTCSARSTFLNSPVVGVSHFRPSRRRAPRTVSR